MIDSNIPTLDRTLHAAQAKLSGGLSPAAIGLAWADWFVHLANQPGRRAELAKQAMRDAMAMAASTVGLPVDPVVPPAGDHRFVHPGWSLAPYALPAQLFLRTERFWRDATTNIPGLSAPHERMVSFMARQLLDMMSPSNIPGLNPEVVDTARTLRGENFVAGLDHLLADFNLTNASTPEKLPLTPGGGCGDHAWPGGAAQ